MNKHEIEKNIKSAIHTIEMLKRLAFNVHGVMDVVDLKNIEFIISALQHQLNNGWIPVSERYPKPKEYSEVWITNINECVSHAYFSDGNFRFDNYGGKAIAREWIIAWKPYAKPEPYKEVSE